MAQLNPVAVVADVTSDSCKLGDSSTPSKYGGNVSPNVCPVPQTSVKEPETMTAASSNPASNSNSNSDSASVQPSPQNDAAKALFRAFDRSGGGYHGKQCWTCGVSRRAWVCTCKDRLHDMVTGCAVCNQKAPLGVRYMLEEGGRRFVNFDQDDTPLERMKAAMKSEGKSGVCEWVHCERHPYGPYRDMPERRVSHERASPPVADTAPVSTTMSNPPLPVYKNERFWSGVLVGFFATVGIVGWLKSKSAH